MTNPYTDRVLAKYWRIGYTQRNGPCGGPMVLPQAASFTQIAAFQAGWIAADAEHE